MTRAICYMDSASQHELVRLMYEPRLASAAAWARRGSVEVTALLIESDSVRHAPAPSAVSEIVGPFAQFAVGIRAMRLVDSPDEANSRRRRIRRSF